MELNRRAFLGTLAAALGMKRLAPEPSLHEQYRTGVMHWRPMAEAFPAEACWNAQRLYNAQLSAQMELIFLGVGSSLRGYPHFNP